MKSIYITLAAVSAAAMAAPAIAQPMKGDRADVAWHAGRSDSQQLQLRYDAAVQSGALSRSQAWSLRQQMRQFMQLEARYSRGGFTRWESSDLETRSRSLSLNLDAAERMNESRFGHDDRVGNDGRFGMNDRQPNRGDRFAGDLRVGQHFSERQVALPMEYRDRYRDSDAAYYRYDDHRVYQIDRVSGLILAMFDTGR
jgi:hypothetical protein